MESFTLFVTCSKLLEPFLAEELTSLNVGEIEIGLRGVYVHYANWNSIYAINYNSRIASRVLLPIKRFKCFDQKMLYQEIREIEWERYIKRGKTLAVDANIQHQTIRNSLYAAQLAKDAICDRLREAKHFRPSVDIKNPDIQLNLFIYKNKAVLSFDTSGKPLHQRGYRQETGTAPLRETLAAAILKCAKYDGTHTLFDPCCGAGTFLIEAALISTSTPPGYLRKNWGFMEHPQFSNLDWLKIRNSYDKHRKSTSNKVISGIDIDSAMVAKAKINIRAAGFTHFIKVDKADLQSYTPKIPPEMLITNPPHGKRLEEETALIPLYRSLGDFMKQKTQKPAKGFVFTGSLPLSKEIGLAAKRKHVFDNGGVESRLLEFDLF